MAYLRPSFGLSPEHAQAFYNDPHSFIKANPAMNDSEPAMLAAIHCDPRVIELVSQRLQNDPKCVYEAARGMITSDIALRTVDRENFRTSCLEYFKHTNVDLKNNVSYFLDHPDQMISQDEINNIRREVLENIEANTRQRELERLQTAPASTPMKNLSERIKIKN